MGDENGAVVTLEQAKSGRSTCRATGELLAKSDWRVGFETWISGRVAMAWMKPLPFLQECCRVEYALNVGSQGSCKASGRKFERGEVRFVCTAGDPQKKIYLSLPAAGDALGPVVEHVGSAAFSSTSFQGLANLAAADRQAFYKAFAVPKAAAARFDREHPPPEAPSLEKPASAAKASKKAAKAAEAAAAAAVAAAAAAPAPEADAEAGSSRPAKRARGGRAAANAAAEEAAGAAASGEGSEDGTGAEPAPKEEEQAQQGLTAMELQRLEQIARNRERLMALNLPSLAAELMPAPPPKSSAGAKHKGVSRKRLSEVLPRRESSRLRGVAADGSQVHSERQGEVVIVAGEVIRRYGTGSMSEEREPQERHPQGELAFSSTNCGHDTDERFIQLLAHAAASANSGDSSKGGGSAAGGSKSGSGGGKGKGKGGGSGGGSGGAGNPLGVASMARMRLAADDVAKVTKEATTHLAFHPTTDTLIVACADKRGNVGLWHVNEGSYELPAAARRAAPILRLPAVEEDGQEEAEEQEAEGSRHAKPAATSEAVSLDAFGSEAPPNATTSSGGGGGAAAAAAADGSEQFDGVLSLLPQHHQYICGLKWAGGAGRGSALFTASYDGSLRRLDVERGVSELAVSSEEAEYSCMDVTGDGRTALLGDNDGALHLVDLRAPPGAAAVTAAGRGVTVHSKKINTVHFEPTQEQVFASASTDTCIHLWDLRALGASKMKPLATANHTQTCQAAHFAPDGSRRIVSTSFDCTLRIWDGCRGLAPLLSIPHDNRTGRWVLPFRAVWNAAGDGVVVGNMQRFVDVFDASTGAMAAQLSSEHMTAIASRNAAHPALPVLASATNSGRIHIYRA